MLSTTKDQVKHVDYVKSLDSGVIRAQFNEANQPVTAPKDAMRKHHKKWNVVQSGHCTVVLLHLAA